jgi:hypothetical protein
LSKGFVLVRVRLRVKKEHKSALTTLHLPYGNGSSSTLKARGAYSASGAQRGVRTTTTQQRQGQRKALEATFDRRDGRPCTKRAYAAFHGACETVAAQWTYTPLTAVGEGFRPTDPTAKEATLGRTLKLFLVLNRFMIQTTGREQHTRLGARRQQQRHTTNDDLDAILCRWVCLQALQHQPPFQLGTLWALAACGPLPPEASLRQAPEKPIYLALIVTSFETNRRRAPVAVTLKARDTDRVHPTNCQRPNQKNKFQVAVVS